MSFFLLQGQTSSIKHVKIHYKKKKKDVKYQFLKWKHLLPTSLALSPLPFERTPLINLDLFIYLVARPLQSKNDTMGRVKQQSDAPIGPSTVFLTFFMNLRKNPSTPLERRP